MKATRDAKEKKLPPPPALENTYHPTLNSLMYEESWTKPSEAPKFLQIAARELCSNFMDQCRASGKKVGGDLELQMEFRQSWMGEELKGDANGGNGSLIVQFFVEKPVFRTTRGITVDTGKKSRHMVGYLQHEKNGCEDWNGTPLPGETLHWVNYDSNIFPWNLIYEHKTTKDERFQGEVVEGKGGGNAPPRNAAAMSDAEYYSAMSRQTIGKHGLGLKEAAMYALATPGATLRLVLPK